MSTSWVPVTDLVEAVLDNRVTDAPLGLAVLAYTVRRGGGGEPL